ncbi:protein phosphatase 1 regulatory subunit 3C-B-like isoform X2 [Salvelinus fontinalis]|uniref:protein phosphatase 1 regulatory subunit 3C-B-like isoform X2 n=1 Tax=Salvelinus fontinalis TaxID=8038 RepID=UPI002485091D|nr:protein phosphatase 1 regulatory subunit 3C-B-like isoform X2 [Salvelinus fontinalis]
MSATRVLHVLNSSAMPVPVMPVDIAMRMYITHSPPLRSFLSSHEDLRARNRANHYKPLRPCISSQRPLEAPSLVWKSPKTTMKTSKGKKRVVFADSKDLENATMELKISTKRSLALDFPQPAADYLAFRNRLLKNSVCLENCTLQDKSLTGTVKVRNLGFEKSVHVRVTVDSWKTYTDIDCTFMNNVYSCQDTDTFAFVFKLPRYVPPYNRVEFCICFKSKDQVFWDNNDGKNYVLKPIGWNGEDVKTLPKTPAERKKPEEHKNSSKLLEMGFDQFGSPSSSSGLFLGLQSWGRIEDGANYW